MPLPCQRPPQKLSVHDRGESPEVEIGLPLAAAAPQPPLPCCRLNIPPLFWVKISNIHVDRCGVAWLVIHRICTSSPIASVTILSASGPNSGRCLAYPDVVQSCSDMLAREEMDHVCSWAGASSGFGIIYRVLARSGGPSS